jgi:hypothetical protein
VALSSLSDLLSGSSKSARFETVGDTITGTVTKAEVRQKSDPDTGQLQTWDDGRPMEQIVVTIVTSLRDPEDPTDDGSRNVYIKGWGDQLKALKDALRVAGSKDVQRGGTFTATLSGKGQKAKAHHSAPNIFTYSYTPPSQAAVAGLLAAGEAAPAPAAAALAPAQAVAAQPAPAAAAALANLTPEQIEQLLAAQQQAAPQPAAAPF